MGMIEKKEDWSRGSREVRIAKRSFALGVVTCFALLAILTYVFGLGRFLTKSQYDEYKGLKDAYGKYYKMTELLGEEALAEYNPEEMNDDVLREVVASLDDPYAQYFTKEEYEIYKKRYAATYVGIGLTVGEFSDDESGDSDNAGDSWNYVVVVKLAEGGPAAEAGIQVGDIILAVDGESVKGATDASERISGEAGTEVELTIERGQDSGVVQEDGSIKYNLVRTKIENKVVSYSIIDAGLSDGDAAKTGADTDTDTNTDAEAQTQIGYVKISSFSKSLSKELKLAIKDFKNQGCYKLIIDLRDNGGGLTNQAYKVADYLLPASVICTETDKSGKETVHKSKAGDAGVEYVVLVNENTASASELVAAACQDNGIKIIGTTTYGKGVTQKTHVFEDGSAVKFTVKEYFRPSGEKVNGVGVVPDIEIESDTAAELEEQKIIKRAIKELGQNE